MSRSAYDATSSSTMVFSYIYCIFMLHIVLYSCRQTSLIYTSPATTRSTGKDKSLLSLFVFGPSASCPCP